MYNVYNIKPAIKFIIKSGINIFSYLFREITIYKCIYYVYWRCDPCQNFSGAMAKLITADWSFD